MKQKNALTLFVALLLIYSGSSLFAGARSVDYPIQQQSETGIGQLMAVMCDGPVYYLDPSEREWRRIVKGQTLQHGDSVRTAAHGYLVLQLSSRNLVMIKPESGLRIARSSQTSSQVVLQLHTAEVMLAARNSAQIEVEGRHGTLVVDHGDASIVSGVSGEIIRAVKGSAAFRLNGSSEATVIPESYSLEVHSDGSELPLSVFDSQSEYESFKRFAGWLNRFEDNFIANSAEIPFVVDSVKINDQFVSNMTQEDNFHLLETVDGNIPEKIHLQLKITPYPAPKNQFEMYLGKDLIYALREGRDGYHEVVFPVPSIPEFVITIHQVDSAGRRVRIFKAAISVSNRRVREQKARQFCKELTDAFARRDNLWLRTRISQDFRDWQGNTWFDFLNMSEDTLRRYRDVRVILHPFRFEFRDGLTLVHLNYRLSALTADWNFRFEDRGSDVFTLKPEDGQLRLYAKVSGLFFNRLKVAVDLRQGVLRGRICDERTRKPLDGVSVIVRGTRYQTVTDSMGEYVIYNMPPGTYDVKFYKNGYGELTATRVTLKAAGEQF
ncbi:MAG: carboxypeptidase-like regulatory domain-containing protein [Candidatus Riflebacteria bacterium]|nr:carboxypeptidase-like regulatory domain-containing protein [Candidatus Riflebacteria bacterium]